MQAFITLHIAVNNHKVESETEVKQARELLNEIFRLKQNRDENLSRLMNN